MKKTFYITTPIYYANDKPHIGHAYTTLLADVLTRYHKLLGYDTFFLTGTDEHGQKVQQAAAQRGVEPQAQVDEFHQRFKDLWEKLEIKYDRFIRTTDQDHREHVQRCLKELHERGEIYLEEYEGWYSVSEERFYTDDELVDGKDPVSGRPVEWIKEKNYFFRMGKYRDRLIKHIEDNPDFIQPDFRRNEVLGFLRQQLNDLCISRPSSRLSWGIPLPFDEDFVTYVWFDALLNYETGVLGFHFPDGSDAWPADYHVIGKDILTTHSVYWPTMLMGMGHELPRHIFAHGWWLTKASGSDDVDESNDSGEKMSKSKGNVVDPLAYAERYGVDVTRYFLMRDMVLGKDATFSHELFITRVNTDLANDLGNAVNRINKFVHSKCGGVLPKPGALTPAETELQELAVRAKEKTVELILGIKLSFALEEISLLVRGVNKYLEQRAPWHVAKNMKEDGSSESETARDELGTILYTAGEALRIALSLLYPVMPGKTPVGLAMLGAPGEPDIEKLEWGLLKGGETLARADALFPRIMDEDKNQNQEQNEAPAKGEKQKQPGQTKGQPNTDRDPATILDFRVAEIKAVADHPDADALYVLTIGDGEGERTVCAGLKSSYAAGELEGRHVVLLANLKPAKLRGVESRGMLLAGGGSTGKAVLLDPGEIPVGTTLAFGDLPVAPKSKVGVKDFQKLEPFVKDGKIYYGNHVLGHAGKTVACDAPDGSEVR